MHRLISSLSLALLLAAPSWAGKPKAQKRWHQVGKNAHAHIGKNKTAKAKNSYCANACRKAGAKKSTDLGACKEGCVFG